MTEPYERISPEEQDQDPQLAALLATLLKYHPDSDTALVSRAYAFAAKAHEGQTRKSGKPYFTHPYRVAEILASLQLDDTTIAAGLLHDCVEDNENITLKEIEAQFGAEVAQLVDGVTKLSKLDFTSREERQAESLRKMFLAMAKDIRVVLIKLADRLHNLRTINYMNEDKIREKCRETLEIYSPLAARLGMYNVRMELEDIALKHLEPEAYQKLVEDVNRRRGEGQPFLDHVIASIREALDKAGINAEIKGRFKHYYSVYRKMKLQKRSLDEIFDLVACRVIVDSVKDCYGALGIVHTLWTPIPGRFKDYIAMPKSNLYQSIHTTVIGDNGQPFEIQIRTHEMNRVAEYGIAAHWKYKEGVTQDPEEFKLAWLRQTLEWQKDLNDSKEFLDTLKVDLFSSQVFVFTPKGDVMELPKGSTPLDFAFKIHSDVGAKCVGAKVNGKMVPIDYELKNGEIISIVTSNSSKGPSVDWLKIAKTNTAKAKIRQYLKKVDRGESVEKGKEMLEKYIRRKGYDPQEVIRSAWMNKAAKSFGQTSAETLYNNISYGGVMLSKVAVYLVDLYHEDKQAELKAREQREAEITAAVESRKAKRPRNSSGVIVEGFDDLLIRFAHCCNPVPGDEIIGFITKGRGVSIHRADCINIQSLNEVDQGRIISVSWDDSKEGLEFEVDLRVLAEDRKGLLVDISRVTDEMGVTITALAAKSDRESAVANIAMTVALNDTKQLDRIIARLKQITGVADVYRAVV